MARKIKIALIQMMMSADSENNVTRAVEQIRKAATAGAQVICLPELFSTPYFCTVSEPEKDYTVEVPGAIGAKLSALAKEYKIVLVGGSVYERDGASNYNTALVYGPDGKMIGKYRKVHIPHDEAFFEQNYFKPGDLDFPVFDTPFGKIGVLICFDQWFPEAARLIALNGAEIIFYPTAIANVEGIEPTEGDWQNAWETVQRGHAIANNVVVAAVNRVGKEGKSIFWGGSFVADAFGKVLVRGDSDEEVLITEVDLDHNKFVRDSWGFFRNRRPEVYTKISQG